MIIDTLFILIAITGFYFGFNQKILTGIAMILLIILASLLSFQIAPYLTDMIGGNYKKMDSSLLFFFGLILSFSIAIFLVKWLFDWLDSYFGGGSSRMAKRLTVGFVIAAILLMGYGSLVSVLDRNDVLSQKTKNQAVTMKYCKKLSKTSAASVSSVRDNFKDLLNHFFDEGKENHKRAKHPKKQKLKL